MQKKSTIQKTIKQIFTWTIFLFSFSTYGQDTISIKERGFIIGVNFSPDYCYRTLTKQIDTLSNTSWKQIKHLHDSIEKAKFGYTFGINFGYQINKRICLETGLQYSNKGYKTIPINSFDSFGKMTNIINYYYLDVPIKINYFFLKKRLQLLVSAGTTLNLFLYSSIKTITEPETATSFKEKSYSSANNNNKFNFSPIFSAGIKYKIRNRMNLRVEPTFRYGIFDIRNDKSFYSSIHLWSIGLNIGCYIEL